MSACIRYIATVKSAASRNPRCRTSARFLDVWGYSMDTRSHQWRQRSTHQIWDSVFQGSFDFMKTSLACCPANPFESCSITASKLNSPPRKPFCAPEPWKILRNFALSWDVSGGRVFGVVPVEGPATDSLASGDEGLSMAAIGPATPPCIVSWLIRNSELNQA